MFFAPTRCRRPYPPAPGAWPGNLEAPGMWCRPIPRLRCGAYVLLAIECASPHGGPFSGLAAARYHTVEPNEKCKRVEERSRLNYRITDEDHLGEGGRALTCYIETGRLLDPGYIESVDHLPQKVFAG